MKPFTAILIGTVWPEPRSSAAGFRDQNLLEMLRMRPGARIILASPSKENDFAQEWLTDGYEIVPIEANDSGFDAWIAEVCPDLVIFDRFIMEEQFGWRVREQCPAALRVVDNQDLHFLRRGRMAGLEVDDECLLREIASYLRSDLTLVISHYEFDLLKGKYDIPDRYLMHLPFTYENPAERVQGLKAFGERSGFMMIGNFRHQPNLDAFYYLKNEVWPEIRKLKPDAKIDIFGAYPPKDISQCHSPQDGFFVRGPVEDHHAQFQSHRVSLAPLRIGAGIKGKISDSWFNGTPVITTSIGAEGMVECDSDFPGIIANDSQTFAENAVGVYENDRLWSIYSSSGLRILKSEYGFKKHAQRFWERIEFHRMNIDKLRKEGLMGRILWHSRQQSTKYFSKWIEAKNANVELSDISPNGNLTSDNCKSDLNL